MGPRGAYLASLRAAREGVLGDTEMQDRLHILEDLNMLYIRQMALSLEVTPRPLDNMLSVLSHSAFNGATEGGGQGPVGPAHSRDRRDRRWFCIQCVGYVWGIQAHFC